MKNQKIFKSSRDLEESQNSKKKKLNRLDFFNTKDIHFNASHSLLSVTGDVDIKKSSFHKHSKLEDQKEHIELQHFTVAEILCSLKGDYQNSDNNIQDISCSQRRDFRILPNKIDGYSRSSSTSSRQHKKKLKTEMPCKTRPSNISTNSDSSEDIFRKYSSNKYQKKQFKKETTNIFYEPGSYETTFKSGPEGTPTENSFKTTIEKGFNESDYPRHNFKLTVTNISRASSPQTETKNDFTKSGFRGSRPIAEPLIRTHRSDSKPQPPIRGENSYEFGSPDGSFKSDFKNRVIRALPKRDSETFSNKPASKDTVPYVRPNKMEVGLQTQMPAIRESHELTSSEIIRRPHYKRDSYKPDIISKFTQRDANQISFESDNLENSSHTSSYTSNIMPISLNSHSRKKNKMADILELLKDIPSTESDEGSSISNSAEILDEEPLNTSKNLNQTISTKKIINISTEKGKERNFLDQEIEEPPKFGPPQSLAHQNIKETRQLKQNDKSKNSQVDNYQNTYNVHNNWPMKADTNTTSRIISRLEPRKLKHHSNIIKTNEQISPFESNGQNTIHRFGGYQVKRPSNPLNTNLPNTQPRYIGYENNSNQHPPRTNQMHLKQHPLFYEAIKTPNYVHRGLTNHERFIPPYNNNQNQPMNSFNSISYPDCSKGSQLTQVNNNHSSYINHPHHNNLCPNPRMDKNYIYQQKDIGYKPYPPNYPLNGTINPPNPRTFPTMSKQPQNIPPRTYVYNSKMKFIRESSISNNNPLMNLEEYANKMNSLSLPEIYSKFKMLKSSDETIFHQKHHNLNNFISKHDLYSQRKRKNVSHKYSQEEKKRLHGRCELQRRQAINHGLDSLADLVDASTHIRKNKKKIIMETLKKIMINEILLEYYSRYFRR